MAGVLNFNFQQNRTIFVNRLLVMKLQLNTDFLNQNVLLAVLAAAQVKGETIEVEPVEGSRL